MKTQCCQIISASKALKFSYFAISNGCREHILCLALWGKEDQHRASYSKQLSASLMVVHGVQKTMLPAQGQIHPQVVVVHNVVVMVWANSLATLSNMKHVSKSCQLPGSQWEQFTTM